MLRLCAFEFYDFHFSWRILLIFLWFIVFFVSLLSMWLWFSIHLRGYSSKYISNFRLASALFAVHLGTWKKEEKEKKSGRKLIILVVINRTLRFGPIFMASSLSAEQWIYAYNVLRFKSSLGVSASASVYKSYTVRDHKRNQRHQQSIRIHCIYTYTWHTKCSLNPSTWWGGGNWIELNWKPHH